MKLFAKINLQNQIGLFLNKNSHQEIKTKIQHLKPNCQSHQDIKNVLTKGSKGVFQGKVLVDQIAQKTNRHFLSRKKTDTLSFL